MQTLAVRSPEDGFVEVQIIVTESPWLILPSSPRTIIVRKKVELQAYNVLVSIMSPKFGAPAFGASQGGSTPILQLSILGERLNALKVSLSEVASNLLDPVNFPIGSLGKTSPQVMTVTYSTATRTTVMTTINSVATTGFAALFCFLRPRHLFVLFPSGQDRIGRFQYE